MLGKKFESWLVTPIGANLGLLGFGPGPSDHAGGRRILGRMGREGWAGEGGGGVGGRPSAVNSGVI